MHDFGLVVFKHVSVTCLCCWLTFLFTLTGIKTKGISLISNLLSHVILLLSMCVLRLLLTSQVSFFVIISLCVYILSGSMFVLH